MTGATIGKFAIVPNDGFIVNQRVGLFNLGENPLNNMAFLFCTLMMEDIQKEIITVGGDSAQANVSNSDIENIKLAFAPTEIIESFNKQCKLIFSLIINNKKEIKILTELQSLLLAKMGQ